MSEQLPVSDPQDETTRLQAIRENAVCEATVDDATTPTCQITYDDPRFWCGDCQTLYVLSALEAARQEIAIIQAARDADVVATGQMRSSLLSALESAENAARNNRERAESAEAQGDALQQQIAELEARLK
jgi:hypothetical protein